MNEEEKAIKFLESKTTKYSLSGEELHYYNILYYLILNLQKENQQLKQKLQQRDNIINKAREYIEENSLEVSTKEYGTITVVNSDDLLEILNIDKGE